jgi:O-antigen/teichoic acid export membrane protein
MAFEQRAGSIPGAPIHDAPAPRALWQRVRERRAPLSLVGNSLALIAAKLATLGLGFVFWVLAARLFARGQVGIAAGVVSALMLCTQLALLGVGSSVITHYREHERDPERLIHSSVAVVVASAVAVAAVFLLIADTLLGQLDVVARSPTYAALFLVTAISGTVVALFDQTSTAMRRGDQALTRGILFGLLTIVVLAAVAGLTAAEGSEAIFVPWAIAGAAACGLGILQLQRVLRRFRLRPRVEAPLLKSLIRVGIPNHALTLAERAPGLIIPILVTELISAQANAAWYAAWMMAWAAYIVPIQVGMTAFVEVAREPANFADVIAHGLRTSLAIGTAAACALIVLAGPLLSLLGPGYAADGETPLRILALGVFPMTFTYAYFSACRGLRGPGRALGFGWVSVVASLGAAAIAGSIGGLTTIAISWVAVQTVFGVWAAVRLEKLKSDLRRAG